MTWHTAILFLIDNHSAILTNDLQNNNKMFCNAFNDRRIFENIVFVFTKFYGKENINKENCVKLVEQTKNINDNFYGKNNGQHSFKSFFVDRKRKNNWMGKRTTFYKYYANNGWRSKTQRYLHNSYSYYENEYLTSKDYNFKYQTTNSYATKRAIDINDKEAIIEPKNINKYWNNQDTKNNDCSMI